MIKIYRENNDEISLEVDDIIEENLLCEFIDGLIDEVLEDCPFCVEEEPFKLDEEIVKVTFNDPATIVHWKDGTKTVTKARNGDKFNPETGLALCIVRYLINNRSYSKVFDKWLPKTCTFECGSKNAIVEKH